MLSSKLKERKMIKKERTYNLKADPAGKNPDSQKRMHKDESAMKVDEGNKEKTKFNTCY